MSLYVVSDKRIELYVTFSLPIKLDLRFVPMFNGKIMISTNIVVKKSNKFSTWIQKLDKPADLNFQKF